MAVSRTLDGHPPLGDITNTYDSQKQCNRLGSNNVDNKYMLRHQQFWFSVINVRVGICTGHILRVGIKCTVVARAEEIKKVHEVPCLGADGYKSALKYVYEYIRYCENLQEIKTQETLYENLD